jgi:hypothetical protein
VTRRSPLAVVAVVAGAGALAGCAIGPRPVLTDETKVDDAAIEAVLDRLEGATAGTFTATYRIQPTLAGTPAAEATVSNDSAQSRVTISQPGGVAVEYVDVDGEQRTCETGLTNCVAGLDDARVSNLNVTSSFWGTSASNRLTAAARANIGDASAPAWEGDQPGVCADVPLAAGTARFCALDAGPLAYYNGADVTIELTSFTDAVAPDAFVSSAVTVMP